MRILIHSNDPQLPTGYGQQTALLTRILTHLGHHVAISAFYGAHTPYLYGTEETPVFPQGMHGYGIDVIIPHAQAWKADVIIPFMDFWKLAPVAQALADTRIPIAPWIPIDCTPLGRPDLQTLRTIAPRIHPIAMSHHGYDTLTDAAVTPLYAPHAVDPEEYHSGHDPHPDRPFTVGIVSANRDAVRKAFPEQLRAFASFHDAHPDSRLILHTEMTSQAGHNLYQLCHDVGLNDDSVSWSDQYRLTTGQYSTVDMRHLYHSFDLLMNASYGEGFGIPLIEAAACGTLALYTEASAMSQTGYGWGVGGEQWYNPVHRAWWVRPSHKQLRAKLDEAYALWQTPAKWNARRRQAVNHSTAYQLTNVTAHWEDVLTSLERSISS